MILTTGPGVDGRTVSEYLGVVFGHAAVQLGFRDHTAGSERHESRLQEVSMAALRKLEDAARSLGADAVIAIDFNYQSTFGYGENHRLMVSASGTAVRL